MYNLRIIDMSMWLTLSISNFLKGARFDDFSRNSKDSLSIHAGWSMDGNCPPL